MPRLGYRKYATLTDAFRAYAGAGGADECHIWKGGHFTSGHGSMRWNGKTYHAHRVAKEIETGQQIPVGMLVCHKCNIPQCVNPGHLYIGTKLDNRRDSDRAGTGYYPHPGFGEAHHQSKLSETKVREIRNLYWEGLGQRKLSRIYGVSLGAIQKVVHYETWRLVS